MIGLRKRPAQRRGVLAFAFPAILWLLATPAAAQDFWVDAPGTWTGNTCGQGDDCYMEVGPEVEYAVDIPVAGYWHFSLCESTFDTLMAIGSVLCSCDYG
jgi:hypothetical protein